MKQTIAALTLIILLALTGCRGSAPDPESPASTADACQATPISTSAPTPTAIPEPTYTPAPSPTPAPLYLEGWQTIPDAISLEQARPDLATVIIALPWVSDGIGGAEGEAVELLVMAATKNEQVFQAVAGRPWVLDGVNRTEQNIIRDLTRFSNEAIAPLIPDMPFLETVEPSDAATVDLLSNLDSLAPKLLPAIAELTWIGDGIDGSERELVSRLRNLSDADVAVSIIALGWVQDGIRGSPETTAFREIIYLGGLSLPAVSNILAYGWVKDGIDAREATDIDRVVGFNDAANALSITEFTWVEDGIEAMERQGIQQLTKIAGTDAKAAARVMTFGWVRDGIVETEVGAIEELSYVAYDDSGLASAVAGLGWMQDGVDELEFEALEWIGNFSDTGASPVVALGWIQDGIEELEVETIRELSYIAYDDLGVAESVITMEWVQDGIKKVEAEAIDWMSNFDDVDVASSVVARSWVEDGIQDVEVDTIKELSWLAKEEASATLRILDMPFLVTIEASDSSAMTSLRRLARFKKEDFQRILSHPTLSSGITDDWAKTVTTLYGVSSHNSDLIDVLLDPTQVTLEERVIDLPLRGETQLAIIRTAPGAERSMDLIEHAVRHAEEFMAIPFPTGYVGYLFGDAVVSSFAGTNFGTHIASLAKYDVDDGSYNAEFAGHHIAHEVAHYYWRGNSDWVDEGTADFMASVSENIRTAQPVEVTNDPCGYARTITALESLAPSQGEDEFTCNYALGERLFVDLYRNLDENSFRQGLQNLYLLSQAVQEEDEVVGIMHVRTAFDDVEGVDDQVVDVITARWYEGTEPYDTSRRDTDPVNRRFITVNGGIDVVYLAATSGGPPATSFSANSTDDWVRLFLDYSYSVGNNTAVPLEIVTYFEDGFVFNRQNENFTAKPGYIGATWWLSVGASPSNPWAPGKYYVYVYNEGRKLVELEYEVTD